MPPLCEAYVPLPIDRESNPSSVPAKIDTAVTHGGRPGRTPSRRINHSLRPGASMAARLPSLWEIMFIASIYATSMMLASGTAHAEPASPTSRTTSIHPTDRFADFITEASRRFDVPAHLLRAVMHLESGAHARALSPKGAMGLMQIMPATYATLRARYALGANPCDPRDNILAGAAYLREMLDRYGASGFLAAYNAGPRRYEEHLRTGRPLPIETQQYVAMLAPIIGGRQFDDRPLVVADAAAWLRALLFPVQAESEPADDRSSPTLQPERRPTDRAIVDLSGLAPQSGDLFVRRIAALRPQ
ncbi:MAG: lytic transglycosylase domain-containing protein [Roseiarcus sp.]